MYTNQSIQAEVSYRQERLTRDYRRFNRATGERRHLIHLFTRHAG